MTFQWHTCFIVGMVEQNGFCMHKSNLLKNFKGEKVQYTFVCSREGHRKDRGLGVENQKHDAKNETKCYISCI